jgi:hypothetical protein
MTGALHFAAAGNLPGGALRALAAAAFCLVVSTAPGKAQFDFLFGNPSPPPAAPQPAAPTAKTPKHSTAKQTKSKS